MNNVISLKTSTNPAPVSWVESLFARMQGMYGNKFLDMWRGADIEIVKSLWAEEMGKLSGDELKRGYAALMTREWPPTLPEYVKMCKPTVDPMVAYHEAVAGVQARSKGQMGKWSHPAIYWAAVPMAFDLASQSHTQIKARWERSLSDSMERGEWDAVPPVMLALPDIGKGQLSREKAGEMLVELGAAEAFKPKSDHRRWARLILERAKQANHGLSALQIRFAKEALAA